MANETKITVTEETRYIIQSYLDILHTRQDKRKAKNKRKTENFEYYPLKKKV